MLTLLIFNPVWQPYIAVLTFVVAAGIFLYGEQNDRITWVWSLALLAVGLALLPVFIIVEWYSVGRRDLWAESDKTQRDELDLRGLPSKWNRKYREDKSQREFRPPKE
jgi:hypothetical protein